MIGTNIILPERSLASVEPLRWKMLVKLHIPKYKGALIIPDTMKKGDTTREASHGIIVKRGGKVEDFEVGAEVALDPSLDIRNPWRCFHDGQDHYMLCDQSDVIAIIFREKTNKIQDQEAVEANCNIVKAAAGMADRPASSEIK